MLQTSPTSRFVPPPSALASAAPAWPASTSLEALEVERAQLQQVLTATTTRVSHQGQTLLRRQAWQSARALRAQHRRSIDFELASKVVAIRQQALRAARAATVPSLDVKYHLSPRGLAHSAPGAATPSTCRAYGGMALTSIGHIGVPLGVSHLLFAGCDAVICGNETGFKPSLINLTGMAVATVCILMPQTYKQVPWQRSARQRLGATYDDEKHHVNQAIDKMLTSYAAPINAAIAVSFALRLTGVDHVAACVTIALFVAALAVTNAEVLQPQRSLLQSAGMAARLFAAAGGSGITSMRESQATRGASTIFAAQGLLIGAMYLQAFASLRHEVTAYQSLIADGIMMRDEHHCAHALKAARHAAPYLDDQADMAAIATAKQHLRVAQADWLRDKPVVQHHKQALEAIVASLDSRIAALQIDIDAAQGA